MSAPALRIFSALAATSPLIPTATAIINFPFLSNAGLYRLALNAPTLVSIPKSFPSLATTGASLVLLSFR